MKDRFVSIWKFPVSPYKQNSIVENTIRPTKWRPQSCTTCSARSIASAATSVAAGPAADAAELLEELASFRKPCRVKTPRIPPFVGPCSDHGTSSQSQGNFLQQELSKWTGANAMGEIHAISRNNHRFRFLLQMTVMENSANKQRLHVQVPTNHTPTQ